MRSRADLLRLRYVPAAEPAGADGAAHGVPPWLDAVLAQAVHPDPERRFQDAAEFIHALRHPGAAPARVALIERDPLSFWKGLCLLLAVALLISLAYR